MYLLSRTRIFDTGDPQHLTDPDAIEPPTPATVEPSFSNPTGTGYQTVCEEKYDPKTPPATEEAVMITPDWSSQHHTALKATEPSYDYPMTQVIVKSSLTTSTPELFHDYCKPAKPSYCNPISTPTSTTQLSSDDLNMTLGTIGSGSDCSAASDTIDWNCLPGLGESESEEAVSHEHEAESVKFQMAVKTEHESFKLFETSVHVERIKTESELMLYEDHEIIEDIVIGPTEVEQMRRPGPNTNMDTWDMEVERLYGCRVLLHSVDKLQCRWCGEWCTSTAALQQHKQTHQYTSDNMDHQVEDSQGPSLVEKAITLNQCQKCYRVFKSQWHLLKHAPTHRELNVPELADNRVKVNQRPAEHYNCHICNKRFKYKGSLVTHLHRHSLESDENTFHCKQCAFICSSRSQVMKHVWMHRAEKLKNTKVNNKNKVNNTNKPFTCDVCEKSFKYKRNLGNHKRCHKPETSSKSTKYQCKKCPSTFTSKFGFVEHVVNHSVRNQTTGKYHCDECDKQFMHRALYTVHYNVHTNTSHYKCKICKSAFDHKSSFKRHSETVCLKADSDNDSTKESTALKPKKADNTRADITNNEKIHNFECSQCHKICLSERHLVKHEISHFGRKSSSPTLKHKCNQCEKEFPYRTFLLEHQASHTETKLKDKSHLNRQLNQTCSEDEADVMQPFTCNMCQVEFNNEESLLDHAKIHILGTDQVDDTSIQDVNENTSINNENNTSLQDSNNNSSQNERDCQSMVRSKATDTREYEYIESNVNMKTNLLRERGFEHIINIHIDSKSQSKYQCSECNRQFISKQHLIQHQATHSNDIFKDTSKRKVMLERDILCHSMDKDKEKKDNPDYGEHLEKDNLSFEKKKKLTKSMRPQDGRKSKVKKLYPCDHCDKKFIKSHSRYVHYRTKHRDCTLICDYCDKRFILKDTLIEHLKIHESSCKKLYVCNFNAHSKTDTHLIASNLLNSNEDKGYTLVETNNEHFSLNASEEFTNRSPKRETKCIKCYKIYKSKWRLIKHKYDVHKVDSHLQPIPAVTNAPHKEHKCKKCNKICKTNWHLLKHESTHFVKKDESINCDEYEPDSTSRNKHKCEHCHKIFPSNYHLIKHRSIHTGLVLRKCDICNEKVKGEIAFKIHLRKHSLQFQKLNKSMLKASSEIKSAVIQSNRK